MNKIKKISKENIIILLIIISTFIVYLSLSFNDSVWQDEAYTMNIIKKDFYNIIKTTAEDVHPPLYYFIAKVFTIFFGYSVTIVKIASIIPVLLTMIFVWLESKKLFKEKNSIITIVFCLLIGFIPLAFVENIELRMYTWAMFFVTCSGIYSYKVYLNSKSKVNMILFIIMGLCAAYTHYYAALTECFIYLFLIAILIKKGQWKESLIIVCYTIAFYIPWLPIFINQFIVVKNYWWLQIFDINTILNFIKFPFNGAFTDAFLVIIVTIFIGMITYILKNTRDELMWFSILSILSFILMVSTASIISLILRPVFIARYMYTAIGLLFLGISIAINKIEYGNLIRNILIGIILLNFPFSYNSAYISEYNTGTEKFKEFVKNNIKEEITITTESNDIAHTLPYYLPNNELKWRYITKDTRGYIFAQNTLEELKKIIPDATIKELYTGDINGTMKFTIYYVE